MFHFEELDRDPPIYEKDFSHLEMTDKELYDRAKFFCKALFEIPLSNCTIYFDNNELLNGCSGKFYGIDVCSDYGPDDHPHILIYEALAGTSYIMLNNILIHELLHYYLWYIGYDFRDASNDFISRARKLGVCVNSDHIWDEENKCWKMSYYSVENLQKYEDAYQKYLKTKKVELIDW